MDFSYGINQEQAQKQKQVLSARMKQSLDILQMPLPDLLRRVDEEALENPVLNSDGLEDGETGETDNQEFKELLQKIQKERKREELSRPAFDGKGDCDPFLFVSKEPTFSDFLVEQLREMKIGPQTAKICRYLIEDLDERGYLPENVEAIADDLRIANVRSVKNAVGVIQNMEPAGVGAFDLRECLILQLQRKQDSSSAEFEIVKQYLELLADNKIKLIAEKLRISIPDAQKFCDRIRKLNPIPSSGFNTGTREKFVLPEAAIQKDESGHLAVTMNCAVTRRLLIDPFYKELAQTTEDRETQKYIRGKIAGASSLIREISNRSSTISRVLKKIIELQPSYFSRGSSYLKPMTMQQIAKELNLNESTVSRAVQDKFILCPLGLVSLKSLFTAQLGNQENGTDVSAAEVKEKIKKCIDEEDKAAPLSDQAIVSELCKQGITLSRRTVAKYRSELKIPVMAKRKTYPYDKK